MHGEYHFKKLTVRDKWPGRVARAKVSGLRVIRKESGVERGFELLFTLNIFT